MKAIKESTHQKSVVQWFRLSYPKLHRCLQASSSGAVLGGNIRARAIQMNSMKANGLVVGQSDLFLAVPRNGYHGLFVEMKSLTGIESSEQQLFIVDMKNQGYAAIVCYGADEAIKEIKKYMNADWNEKQLDINASNGEIL